MSTRFYSSWVRLLALVALKLVPWLLRVVCTHAGERKAAIAHVMTTLCGPCRVVVHARASAFVQPKLLH